MVLIQRALPEVIVQESTAFKDVPWAILVLQGQPAKDSYQLLLQRYPTLKRPNFYRYIQVWKERNWIKKHGTNAWAIAYHGEMMLTRMIKADGWPDWLTNAGYPKENFWRDEPQDSDKVSPTGRTLNGPNIQGITPKTAEAQAVQEAVQEAFINKPETSVPNKGGGDGDEEYAIRTDTSSHYEGNLCSVCAEPQFETESGVTCKNGHGGAPPL